MAPSPRPDAESASRVGPADVAHIDDFLRLLRALDDPLAGSTVLAEHVAAIPVLAARCIRRATTPRRAVQTVDQALALIGNHGLEAILLQVLEELTVAKAEAEGR